MIARGASGFSHGPSTSSRDEAAIHENRNGCAHVQPERPIHIPQRFDLSGCYSDQVMRFIHAAFGPRTPEPPNAQVALRRLVILSRQILHGLASPPPDVLTQVFEKSTFQEREQFADHFAALSAGEVRSLKETRLWGDVTPAERSFLETPLPKVQDIINATWLMESAVCLLWALHYVDELPGYDKQADPELLKLLSNEGLQGEMVGKQLRDRSLIEQARDFAERWHWRSRTRQIQEAHERVQLPAGLSFEDIIRMSAEDAVKEGMITQTVADDFPAFGKAYRDLSTDEWSIVTSISMERHRAFNWLCGYAPRNRWDRVPTET